MINFDLYKEKYHVSLNFYAVFLLITFIPDIIGANPGIFIYFLWALKASLALLIIYKYQYTIYNLTKFEKLFIFIVFIYFTNLFIDIVLEKNAHGYGSYFDLLSFTVSMLIALSFRYDPTFYSNKSFNFFITALSIGLFIAFFMAQPSPAPLIGRFDANSTVNTINYGQIGCTLSLIAIFGFFNKSFKWSKIIFTLLFCLGMVSIMKAGSRSPIVVLVAVSMFYAIAKLGFSKGILIALIVSLMVWLSLDFIVELGAAFDSGLATRIISAVEKKETSGRDAIYLNTWNIITESPIFGDFYLIPSGIGRNGYPHNFFLEAFLTTGLLGGIPFVIMTCIVVFRSFKLLQNNHASSWLILLFLQLQVYGMFSSSLYSSQDYWALCFFILSMTLPYNNIGRVSNTANNFAEK